MPLKAPDGPRSFLPRAGVERPRAVISRSPVRRESSAGVGAASVQLEIGTTVEAQRPGRERSCVSAVWAWTGL